MIKECKWCGKSFVVKDNRDKYCSDECRKESFRKYQREYKHKNPPINKPKKPKLLITCVVCGKEFVASSHNRIYCSDECKRERQLELQRSYRLNRKNPQPEPQKTYLSRGIEYRSLSPDDKFFYGRTQQKAYADDLKVIIPEGLTKVKYRDA